MWNLQNFRFKSASGLLYVSISGKWFHRTQLLGLLLILSVAEHVLEMGEETNFRFALAFRESRLRSLRPPNALWSGWSVDAGVFLGHVLLILSLVDAHHMDLIIAFLNVFFDCICVLRETECTPMPAFGWCFVNVGSGLPVSDLFSHKKYPGAPL